MDADPIDPWPLLTRVLGENMKRIVLILLGLVAVAVGLFYARKVREPNALYALTSVKHERVVLPRLSIPTTYRECKETPPSPGETMSRADCGEREDAPVDLDIDTTGQSMDPGVLRMSALAAVIWGDHTATSLDEAIIQLTDALLLGGDSVPLLVDLSGVHLFRAQQTQSFEDVLKALNYAERALAVDSLNQAALFNAALATEATFLDAQARKTWDAYWAVDSASPWAHEARQHRSRLLEPPPLKYPTATSTTAEVDSFAVRWTAEARNFGWDTVLGRWGSAVLNDSVARADSLLGFAERLGAALARHSGDATLADAVDSIRRAQDDPAAIRTLALAHRDYAKGERSRDLDTLDRMLALKPPSSALRAWASASRAATLAGPNRGAAKVLCDSLLSQIDSLRYPALAARLHWIAGRVLENDGDYRAANGHFKAAAQTYKRIHDTEYFGTTRFSEGFTAYEQGDAPAGYRMVHQALQALRSYRSSRWLNKALFDLAKYTERDGMLSVTAAIHEEASPLAIKAGDTVTVVEGLLMRAQLWAITGAPSRGMPYLDSAAVLIARFDVERRQLHENLLRFSRATTGAGSIASSITELDSAVTYFTEKKPDALWRMAALMARADLHLAAEDTVRAWADLESITVLMQRVSEREDPFYRRSTVIEQARSRFDTLVMLHLRAGQPLDALKALERGRVSFDSAGQARAPARGALELPPGQVALDYALLGDTLFTWVVRDGSMVLLKQRVPREALRLTIERANAALSTPGQSKLADPHLRSLYDWLIRPVRNQLGERETPVVIIADGEIARVPFPALLRDGEREHYLIQDHPLRFAASLAEASRPALPASSGFRALLVADPEFTQTEEYGTLDPLTRAREEIQSLRSFYPDADTLSGENATLEAFRAHAPRANVIHYAGHARFDDTRPERSYLVLAGTGRLSADSVSSLDLGGVRLIVLAACSTVRARQGRSGGFAGLSGELLSAGAGGVVGSLWKVDDALARPLMEEFHRVYSRSGDAMEALRAAQLKMLASDDGERSPAVWAGFRYMGR